jgi:RNA polymerase sigma-70 factor, ECF subfamily
MGLRPNMRVSRVSKIASGSVSKGVIGSARRMSTSESVPELAFEALVATDARRLYTLALSILRDEGEAEDAVQETLLKAWRSWPSISQSDHLPRWLTRVCVNHCTTMRRHLRARGWPPLELFEAAGSSGGPSKPAEIVDVDRAYRNLSIRQRAAITLNYRYGYSVEESASFMGCRPGTVRTHVARGLASLRKELGDA